MKYAYTTCSAVHVCQLSTVYIEQYHILILYSISSTVAYVHLKYCTVLYFINSTVLYSTTMPFVHFGHFVKIYCTWPFFCCLQSLLPQLNSAEVWICSLLIELTAWKVILFVLSPTNAVIDFCTSTVYTVTWPLKLGGYLVIFCMHIKTVLNSAKFKIVP